jgi:hypothetical protein
MTSQTYDLISKKNVDHLFATVGFTYIDDSHWSTITTSSNQFVKETIVLVSIPESSRATPAVVKLQQEAMLNEDKTVTFSMKLVQPNDSFCSKQFYTPQWYSPVQVSWMVMEVGAYSINGQPFIAGKGIVTRSSVETVATFANGNLNAVWFPTGCDSPTVSCVLDAADRGAIGLVQTNNNVKEAGKTLYLTVRAKIIDYRRGQWVLVPHDVAGGVATYHQLTEEVLGYLAFQVGASVQCAEGLSVETFRFYMNYIPLSLSYTKTYHSPPGVFGTVGTITSLCNTYLRSSDPSTTGKSLILSEDQCVTAETRHLTSESVFALVIGQTSTGTGDLHACSITP